MTRTGPQKIPGASQAHFYGTGRYSGSDMEVNCGVAHTTEGRDLPSYNGGAEAPTVTGLPDCKARKIRWYQHYDVDESARALVNKLGGVETNTANTFQVELVGTCDPKTRDAWVKAGHRQDVDFIFWPEAPDWALAEVAWLVRWLHDYHAVPLTCVKDWLAYGKDSRRPGITPASYGASPARMTMTAWRSFTGWCGHQHVPENDHGDPGSMNFTRVITLAKDTTAPAAQTSEELDMDKTQVFDAVWDQDKAPAPATSPTVKTNKFWKPLSYLQEIYNGITGLRADLAALSKKVDALGKK
ncbi:hypothetical protein B0675_02365 [Streptomyces sp. M41(2017)]|uniref:hypothetical protein n=1 Tax=Streptomyces sp. M41(2017) TaxID=1955065 RepID=UPI0009F0F2F7|nr:hypothetical protein [Streptomyces sp. M41(2017)]OQQ16147.1 hypothetical protein B0675_02365 [Streptomyces sp. M41(2017)]